MAPRSKISGLSFDLRRELNERLLNGQQGPQILPWLNTHPELIRRDLVINDENLSNWRQGGFAEYVDKTDREQRLKDLAEWSVRFAEASEGAMSKGALAIAAGRITEVLETAGDDDLNNLIRAVATLHKQEMDARKVDQRDQQLSLSRDRFRWSLAEKIIEFARDDRARDIATRPDVTQEDRIQQLLAYMDEVESAAVES